MADTPRSLLERVRSRGDAAAWDEFVGLYRPLLAAWFRRHPVQPADVDDLAQDVLAALVVKLPGFVHSGRPGAFRTWLRAAVAFQLRTHWRNAARRPAAGGPAVEDYLAALESPGGDAAREWDAEHDRHVVRGLLARIRDEFSPTTWAAFEAGALGGRPAAAVAAELGLTPNAVFIARSRVLRRLREEAAGLLDECPPPGAGT